MFIPIEGNHLCLMNLCLFLHSLRIPTSITSVYTPSCNGQCEKYNDIIWSGIKLALKERDLPISKWEVVLPQVLHSMRSLLCTTTNETPHERFFDFQRRSVLGVSVPTWLSSPELFMYASTPAKANLSHRLKKPI